MEKFLRKLIKTLKQEFPGADTDIEITVPGQKVGGFVIWDGFEDMDSVDRHELMWERLEQRLTKDECRSVNALFAMTTSEMAMARQG